MTLRPLEAHEWELFRELRLAALRDAPDAFGPTLAEALEATDRVWQRFARGFAEADGSELIVAELGGRAVGLVSAGRRKATGRIGAMWVAPPARGAGVARRLLEAACRVLEEGGCERISLSVTENNARAIALYRSFGFSPTGESHPLREGSPLEEIEMERLASP